MALVYAVSLMAAASSGAQDNPRRTVRDGAFTAAQADRGERDYGRECERCHGADLSGDSGREVPALIGAPFLERWDGHTVKDLFEQVKRSMPADSPDSLTTRAYVDIVAFLLSRNEFPSGADELSRTADRLQDWVIERPDK
jgi:cytochrome c